MKTIKIEGIIISEVELDTNKEHGNLEAVKFIVRKNDKSEIYCLIQSDDIRGYFDFCYLKKGDVVSFEGNEEKITFINKETNEKKTKIGCYVFVRTIFY